MKPSHKSLHEPTLAVPCRHLTAQRGNEGDYAAGIAVATLVISIATIPFVQFLLAL